MQFGKVVVDIVKWLENFTWARNKKYKKLLIYENNEGFYHSSIRTVFFFFC